MWTDRLVTIFLAAIAALLTAYFFQPAGMRSASAATTVTIGDVALIKDISTPGVKTIVPLSSVSSGTSTAAVFAIQSSDHVYVYRVVATGN